MNEPLAKTRVLFVCLGNICRSPTAEGMLRERLVQVGLVERVEVDSCGTGDWHVGEPPDARAIAAGAARGLDIAGLRGRQLRPRDFTEFDEILVMDQANLERVLSQKPAGATARVSRLMAYAGQPETDVPDPYFGGDAGFDFALDQIETAVEGLVSSLTQRLAAKHG